MTTTTLNDTLFGSRELCKDARSRLSMVAYEMQVSLAAQPGNFGLIELVKDVRATLDTIDYAVLAYDHPGDDTDATIRVKMSRFIRQARMMVSCLSQSVIGLGGIHELLRDAYGPLGNHGT